MTAALPHGLVAPLPDESSVTPGKGPVSDSLSDWATRLAWPRQALRPWGFLTTVLLIG